LRVDNIFFVLPCDYRESFSRSCLAVDMVVYEIINSEAHNKKCFCHIRGRISCSHPALHRNVIKHLCASNRICYSHLLALGRSQSPVSQISSLFESYRRWPCSLDLSEQLQTKILLHITNSLTTHAHARTRTHARTHAHTRRREGKKSTSCHLFRSSPSFV
jgi:hypothetical protein